MADLQQEHVEAAMEEVVRATSELSFDDVQLVVTALQAGWLTWPERDRLARLRKAFGSLLPNDDDEGVQ